MIYLIVMIPNDLDINIQNLWLASALITWDHFSALHPMGYIAKRHCGNGVQTKIQGESECRKIFKMSCYEILPSKEKTETEFLQIIMEKYAFLYSKLSRSSIQVVNADYISSGLCPCFVNNCFRNTWNGKKKWSKLSE